MCYEHILIKKMFTCLDVQESVSLFYSRFLFEFLKLKVELLGILTKVRKVGGYAFRSFFEIT